ncbi:MAG: 4-diphosphocytidyl-2-C-methyl-D-erythritol kinase [Candidatus Sumerlaeota bacterium]|nr:4-diphosphocytidyl-2-C-methyl-D-erythritol kinase [Candidatus Sumerlaeota bacterium]
MIRATAPAKINLSLDVLRRRPDGFHDLETIFQEIGWCDELCFAPAETDSFRVDGPFASGIPTDATNLVRRAVAALRARCPGSLPPLHVVLTKNVPSGAGLGGGSSDAAATLRVLAASHGLDLPQDELETIAASLGSDCAFFIRGGTAHATGRGENLEPLVCKRDYALLVAVPPVSVSTARAFGALEPRDLGAQTDWPALRKWVVGEADLPPLHNTFERPVCSAYPSVSETLAKLRALNPLDAQLSGSGAACFAVFPDVRSAARAAGQWEQDGTAVRVCLPGGGGNKPSATGV